MIGQRGLPPWQQLDNARVHVPMRVSLALSSGSDETLTETLVISRVSVRLGKVTIRGLFKP